jgi:hypothetical protein
MTVGPQGLGLSPRDPVAFQADAVNAVNAVNNDASVLVREGLEIMAKAGPEAAARALACFDRALDLRRQLPVETRPMLQYDLAGTWLNRAAALVSIGGADSVRAALCAYDTAIQLLCALPLDADPRFPRRLAIAFQNRALARRGQGDEGVQLAREDFLQALVTLGLDLCDALADRSSLLATVWVNLADIQANEPTEDAWRRAIASTNEARHLIGDTERKDVAAAEIGLMARHICCRAVAKCLARGNDGIGAVPDDLHVATDAADEGLELARFWESHGLQRFRDLAEDLFRFGAQAYGMFQPHFVAEFISEQSPGIHLRSNFGGPP